MLTRKPCKGDQLEHRANWLFSCEEWRPLGTVDHCDGNICWYELAGGRGAESFIWRFSDTLNRLVRIKE